MSILQSIASQKATMDACEEKKRLRKRSGVSPLAGVVPMKLNWGGSRAQQASRCKGSMGLCEWKKRKKGTDWLWRSLLVGDLVGQLGTVWTMISVNLLVSLSTCNADKLDAPKLLKNKVKKRFNTWRRSRVVWLIRHFNFFYFFWLVSLWRAIHSRVAAVLWPAGKEEISAQILTLPYCFSLSRCVGEKERAADKMAARSFYGPSTYSFDWFKRRSSIFFLLPCSKSGNPKNPLARLTWDFRCNTSVSFLLMQHCSWMSSQEYKGIS